MTNIIVNVAVADKKRGVFVPWLEDITIDMGDAPITQDTIAQAFKCQYSDLIHKKGLQKCDFAFILRWKVMLCRTAKQIEEALNERELHCDYPQVLGC